MNCDKTVLGIKYQAQYFETLKSLEAAKIFLGLLQFVNLVVNRVLVNSLENVLPHLYFKEVQSCSL